MSPENPPAYAGESTQERLAAVAAVRLGSEQVERSEHAMISQIAKRVAGLVNIKASHVVASRYYYSQSKVGGCDCRV